MSTPIQRIAVLTSGGDAPGMNAAVRAIVRTGLAQGWEVLGVRNGYAGLLDGQMDAMASRDVAGILHLGGTVLGSARCPEFATEDGQRQALAHLQDRGVDAVVVIGGNGSQTGAAALAGHGMNVVGVASTIDNDLVGSDITIGADSAINTALEAIDRLKTTASSHRRAFLVEVMGRDCGYLALCAGIAGGAEAIVVPEYPTTAAGGGRATARRLRTGEQPCPGRGRRRHDAQHRRTARALPAAPGRPRVRTAGHRAGPCPARCGTRRLRPAAGHAPGRRRHRTAGRGEPAGCWWA
jgi:6-phosphofructokinase